MDKTLSITKYRILVIILYTKQALTTEIMKLIVIMGTESLSREKESETDSR